MQPGTNRVIAIVGAGPAGLYAARQLASQGYEIFLFNRDIKPGGLAEYGIYVDKHKLKEGMRAQFRAILNTPTIHYLGNIHVGADKDLTLEQLQAMGFDAILITAGAQSRKSLQLPGENLSGVFHASELVFQYNHLPPFSTCQLPIGERVIVVGAGNVMMDITHYLIDYTNAKNITIVVRRGPGEIKFDQKELESVAANIDLAALQAELQRISPEIQHLGQDLGKFVVLYQNSLPGALKHNTNTPVRIRFLSSPVGLIGDAQDKVTGLQVELNHLVEEAGTVKPEGSGKTEVLPADTVIFAIGDQVELDLGLPLENHRFAVNPVPSFPVNETSYEAYDPDSGKSLPGVFLAGWARQASVGVVGIAKRDGLNAAQAVTCYLDTFSRTSQINIQQMLDQVKHQVPQLVSNPHVFRLEEEERKRALAANLEEFKFDSNEEMLKIIQG
jgi:ferredoxin/flavodoxin---NADP+ reductase